ncbi:MAG: formate dehydrogenase accessory sulfurtransferase FdhD [Verrucomicrobiaceae bacterium]|jgi:FdhD protein|nr:formate dehydrogenase accessory sulfurtransferase FdhD [Verrucomicrobiales bacterium]MDA7644192.1 formate dehydrogenase accessory sulfurtransferase FdhD [Verrucomicrobiales bacterium]NCF93096.1 formate dehydrogenase accessory sulfurtransferase FdhD [Verrucomicrobiaceae bacterium]
MSDPGVRAVERKIIRYRGGTGEVKSDSITVEEPLEIRVDGTSVAVVMRTPGDDLDLTRGFLLTEGLVKQPSDIFEISQCPSQESVTGIGNVVDVLLTNPSTVDLKSLSRNVYTSSSCGICGRATLESVFQQFPPIESDLAINPIILGTLSDKLRNAQQTFAQTGGLHASALFDTEGNLLLLREDVGRHNALDKVIGKEWQAGNTPMGDRLLLVSGRVSFELMQKALCAGIPFVVGISAPSSLAIDCAKEGNQTLIGFLRGETMNVYAHAERLLS